MISKYELEFESNHELTFMNFLVVSFTNIER